MKLFLDFSPLIVAILLLFVGLSSKKGAVIATVVAILYFGTLVLSAGF